MQSSKITDKILYLRLKDKDKKAFVKAYDIYVDDIYRFIYFKVSQKEEAEDITSQVFLKVWNFIQDSKLGEYNSLKPLLYQVARNAVIDYYRKKQNDISLDAGAKNFDIVDEKQNPAKAMNIDLDMGLVTEALNKLKDEYKEVLVLKYLNELETKEIAKILNKSRANVRVLIYRATSALKKVLEDKK
jgi:RNA polymerase sigma-70 factor (ECF subfamily)